MTLSVKTAGPALVGPDSHSYDRNLAIFLTVWFGQTPISFRNLFET
jgi:hypothetical protein